MPRSVYVSSLVLVCTSPATSLKSFAPEPAQASPKPRMSKIMSSKFSLLFFIGFFCEFVRGFEKILSALKRAKKAGKVSEKLPAYQLRTPRVWLKTS
jgi:hypothetical protein